MEILVTGNIKWLEEEFFTVLAEQKEFEKLFFTYHFSLGHWGEWHVKSGEGIVPIPEESVCMQYVDQYVEAFPDVQLMMRRPFLGVKEYGLGVYNDMTGEAEDTREWLEWLEQGGVYTEPAKAHTLYAISDFYKKAAVGGEFTSARCWEELLVTDMDTTKSLIRQSHMSFIGPKVPHALEAPQYQQEAAVIRELLGYKLGISKAVVKRNRLSGVWNIAVTWNNQGIAPCMRTGLCTCTSMMKRAIS